MYAISSISLASLALFSSSALALPALPYDILLDDTFFGLIKSVASQTTATSTTTTSTTTTSTTSVTATFPTLSVAIADVAAVTGSASGYAWATGTGSGYAYPTGTTYPTTTSSATSTESTGLPSELRGVNIGNWLILEEWMNSTMFEGTSATDQWSFDSTSGAAAKLEEHWSTYFTEWDVEQIASFGLNAVRIPIGFWAYDNTNTPYISGADAYLEKAIGWCRTHGIKVLIDCHGSPGSQNGYDNSGHAGVVAWQTENYLNQSISILETISAKYGAASYADVVFGIELVNEPIYWDSSNFGTTKQWAQDAYYAVKAAATNPDLIVVMHDSFMGPSEWEEVSSNINGDCSLADSMFWIDTHLYQNEEATDSLLTQEQHVQMACDWSSTKLLPSWSNLPVIVGEFSADTNICANPDGSTVAGSVCWLDGCQCSSNVDIKYWNEPLVNATRQFVEAQLDTFEGHARGWFMWAYKGPGSWGYNNAIEYGLIGKDPLARVFPGQCSS